MLDCCCTHSLAPPLNRHLPPPTPHPTHSKMFALSGTATATTSSACITTTTTTIYHTTV